MQIDLFYKTEIIQWETCHDFSGLNVPLGEKKSKERKKKNKSRNRNRPMDIENKFIVTKGEGRGRDKLRGWD